MIELPRDLDEAIAQARGATKAAIKDGYRLLQVDLALPELKTQAIAEKFLPVFEELGLFPKVFFPDTGAAALARRDWGEVPFKIADMGSRRLSIEAQVEPEDECFVALEPSAVEVTQVEKLCQAAGDRPVVMLLPRLEDIATIGIGYTARQLRERFLNSIESCYYIRPLESGSLFRCYPSPWQVWQETEDGTDELISETPQKPVGEVLERILVGQNSPADSPEEAKESSERSPRKGPGFMTELQRLFKALNQ